VTGYFDYDHSPNLGAQTAEGLFRAGSLPDAWHKVWKHIAPHIG